MTLVSMIRNHDDSVLETLSSKGLLRRARQDYATGRARLESVEEYKAVVSIDGQTIELVAKGPALSSCTCRAQGVCRHILVAILLLRAESGESQEPEGSDEVPGAVAHICSLTDEQVIAFAGSDWGRATDLFLSRPATSFTDSGVTVTVRVEELNAVIAFVAGEGLEKSAYKGPVTRRRLLTTLAALALRDREGLRLPKGAAGPTTGSGLSTEFLDQAQHTIEQAVAATLSSRSAIASDLLLNLAISSRCEALPRLSAELRALGRQSQLASSRSVEIEPEAFLLAASRAYALLQALRANPTDLDLLGSLRRDYRSAPNTEIWPLGVARWRSDTGARGLTAYLLDPVGNRWLSAIEGRSPGTDPRFEVSSAYHMTMWGAGTLSGLMGSRVRLSQPGLAGDGSISAAQHGGSAELGAPVTLNEILQSPMTHTDWQALMIDLESRMGSGIRRRPVPLPALISPAGFGRIGFNDMDQSYEWEAIDRNGRSLILSFPADDEDIALRLWNLGRKIEALVIRVSHERSELSITPVSALMRNGSRVSVHNVDFDMLPMETGLGKIVSRLKETWSTPLVTSRPDGDAIDLALSDAERELVSRVAGGAESKSEQIVRRLDACGLATLARALRRALASGDLSAVLKAGYVLSELRAALAVK